ncbi:MAG TPA: hypothetical protein VFK72_12120, partial [Nevskia sp.]|nr:hypothetical protein [Nevskia sp.]
KLGYYSNLITSGIGMDAARARSLKAAGLDHIQVSFQSSEANQNDEIAGMRAYAHKLDMARAVIASSTRPCRAAMCCCIRRVWCSSANPPR